MEDVKNGSDRPVQAETKEEVRPSNEEPTKAEDASAVQQKAPEVDFNVDNDDLARHSKELQEERR